jgi:hypothetical protein
MCSPCAEAGGSFHLNQARSPFGTNWDFDSAVNACLNEPDECRLVLISPATLRATT